MLQRIANSLSNFDEALKCQLSLLSECHGNLGPKITFKENQFSRAVVSNRGAAAYQGAAKRCQGCHQIQNYCLLLHKVPPNYYFKQLGVPPNIFKDLKGAANRKRLKNTALEQRCPTVKRHLPQMWRQELFWRNTYFGNILPRVIFFIFFIIINIYH